MTNEEKLQTLKTLIDEWGHPTFTDTYLASLIQQDGDILALARTLLMKKASIPDIKLGDVTIKSPKEHYIMLMSQLRRKTYDEFGNVITRKGSFRTMVRADGQ